MSSDSTFCRDYAGLAVTPAAVTDSAQVLRTPLDTRDVILTKGTWLAQLQQRISSRTIAHCIQWLERSGVIDNFRRIVGESGAQYRGFVFADSDLYKVIEAVAWDIARTGTDAYDTWLDEVIDLVARVQEPSGYCHTWIQGVHPEKKFAELEWTHELYVLGHMIQAAVALTRATGRHDLLDIAVRFATLVERRFGPGRENGIPGHPEIETALVELFRLTHQERWLTLAQHFIDQRGKDILPDKGFGRRYYQDHLPVRQSADPAGHAVRQFYLNAGITDVYLETADTSLRDIMIEQWDRTHERKMYLSGAYGSRHRDESLGNDYELPSDRAYAETCATIADLQWTWRMMLAHDDPRYAETIEREIVNALAASVDESGTHFFYSNPMQRRPDRFSEENAPAERQEWYSCACCPPNISRALAQISSYMATVRHGERMLEIHQLFGARIRVPAQLGGGELTIETRYPADGAITFHLTGSQESFTLALRIPQWAAQATLARGQQCETISLHDLRSGYLSLDSGQLDGLTLTLDMTPRWIAGHHRIDAVRGCRALMRGPVLYCLESHDVGEEAQVDDIYLPHKPQIEEKLDDSDADPLFAPPLQICAATRDSDSELYHQDEGEMWEQPRHGVGNETTCLMRPFAQWGNRGMGAMRVWIPIA